MGYIVKKTGRRVEMAEETSSCYKSVQHQNCTDALEKLRNVALKLENFVKSLV